MSDQHPLVERRALLKGAMAMAGVVGPLAQAVAQPAAETRLSDQPLSSNVRATVERRGQVVLIGIHRPEFDRQIGLFVRVSCDQDASRAV